MSKPTVGIIGAGKLGITLAQLMLKTGYLVYIAGSGSASKIALATEVLAPRTRAVTAREAIEEADIVILALPLSKFQHLPPQAFEGKLVIDAMNYWWEIDGPRTSILPDDMTTSEFVQNSLLGARVVKAFNHMGYHDLFDETKPAGEDGRKTIAIAGDNHADIAAVSRVVDDLGFDPLVIGALKAGRKLEAGQPAFGANLEKAALQKVIAST